MEQFKPEKDHCPVCSTKWTVSGFGKKIWYDCGPCVKTAEELLKTSNTDHLLPEASFQIELESWQKTLEDHFDKREEKVKKIDGDDDDDDEFDNWNFKLKRTRTGSIRVRKGWQPPVYKEYKLKFGVKKII